jgi:hypothetical protein
MYEVLYNTYTNIFHVTRERVVQTHDLYRRSSYVKIVFSDGKVIRVIGYQVSGPLYTPDGQRKPEKGLGTAHTSQH